MRVTAEHRVDPTWQLIAQLGEELSAALNSLAADSFAVLDMVKASTIDDDEHATSLPKGCEELFQPW